MKVFNGQFVSKKMILEIIAGIFFQIMGVAIFFAINGFLESKGIYLDIFGDKSKILLGLFIALPLGCLAGIVFIDRITNKTKKWNLLGSLLALSVSLPLNILAIVLMDIYGSMAIAISLILVPIAAVAAYNLFCHLPQATR